VSVKEDLLLFTTMIGVGCLAYYWLRQRISNGSAIINNDRHKGKLVLFGVPIDQIDSQQALAQIERFVKEKRAHLIITPDTLAILRARKDKQYLEITQKADLVTPDGAGILWAAAFLVEPLPERITGIDMINQICQLAVQKRYSLYLLGAEEEIVKKAARNLELEYPGLNIAGYHHGYFDNNEDKVNYVINDIIEKKPDFLLVGMGVPKQEIWISKYKDRLGVPVCIGIGGSFDVISGKISRAPLWMQNHGMEWIFRIIKEPKRIKRMAKLPSFIWLVFLGKIELLFCTEY
jgi:N-acetylglucosaminyldiphosphoundecaprenol N-acetyl-beta-D-mannosaminyltransferase